MSQKSSNVSWWLIKTVLAGILAATAAPSLAQAQATDPSRGTWMASSSNEATLAGRGWGRLTVADGELAFHSPNYEWHLALPDIKRIGTSKDLSNALEVESASGQVYYVAILDGRLMMTSPGKAMQTIQRAVRVAPAPTSARPAITAGGDGQPR